MFIEKKPKILSIYLLKKTLNFIYSDFWDICPFQFPHLKYAVMIDMPVEVSIPLTVRLVNNLKENIKTNLRPN